MLHCSQNVYQIKHFANGILNKLKFVKQEERLQKAGVNQQHARLSTDHVIGPRSNVAIDCYQRLSLSTITTCKTLEQSYGNSKQMWNSVNKILHRVPEHYLPDHTSLKLLTNSFAQYFGKIIEIIRSNFQSVPLKVPNIELPSILL